MKRVLVILAPILLVSNNIYAQTPTITVGGFINSSGAYKSQSSAFNKQTLPDSQPNKMNSNPDFINETEIYAKIISDSDLGKYGAFIEADANASTNARNEGFHTDKAYIFNESPIGKIEFGNNMSVAQKMKVGPDSFARGAGGINGKYLEYINMPMLADSTQGNVSQIGNCSGYKVNSGTINDPGSNCVNIKLPRFILIPQLPIAHGGYAKGFYSRTADNDYNNKSASSNFGFNNNKTASEVNNGSLGDLSDATKISYYTPRISGWQFGVSGTPDTNNTGTSSKISADNGGGIKDVIDYGINYSGDFNNVGVAFSLTGENGKFEQSSSNIARHNLQAYEAGVIASYLGFTFGGSYGIWGKSLQPKSGIYSCNYDSSISLANQTCSGAEKKFKDATYYTAGAAYQFGPVAASLTYLSSNFQENKYEALSLGIDYKMIKGLMPYVEITKYGFKSNQPISSDYNQAALPEAQRQIKDNSGYVALVGLLFSF